MYVVTLYIVRHGETDSNLRHTCVGHKDVALNENGMRQAGFLCERLRSKSFDYIYVSPLKRAVDTIMPLARVKKRVPVVMNYGLIERDYGRWDDMTFEEIEESDPEGYKNWHSDWIDFVIPDGESAAQVQSRINETIDNILSAHGSGNIIVVTHLGAARHILSHLLGLSTEQSWLFTLDNAKYASVAIDNGKAVLTGLNL